MGTNTAASTGVPSRPGMRLSDSFGISSWRSIFFDNTVRNHSGFKCLAGTGPNFNDEGTQGWVIGSKEGRVGGRRTRGLSGGVADITANHFKAKVGSFLTETCLACGIIK